MTRAPIICRRCDRLDDPARGYPCPCTAWRLRAAERRLRPRRPFVPPAPPRPRQGRTRRRDATEPAVLVQRWAPVIDLIFNAEKGRAS